MIVQINPRWRVVSEAHQWVVQRGRIVKDRDRWDAIAFCKSLDSVIVWLHRNRVWPDPGVYDSATIEPLTSALDAILSDLALAMDLDGKSRPAETIAMGDDWRLVHDSLQWIVQLRRTSHHGNRWDAIAYFRHLAIAVRAAAEARIRLSEGTYCAEALSPLCRATDRLKDMSEWPAPEARLARIA